METLTNRRWWILAALSLSLLVVGLDATVLNVALSDISAALGASNTELQWVSNGYILMFAVLLMPAGVLGDRVGRSPVLAAGLLVFVIGSMVAAWSTSPAMLIGARAVMGLGAAAIFPLALSILPTVFGPSERARAVAVVTAAMGIGMPVGPLVGGWLLDHYWWGSTLLINVPLVLIALVAGIVLIPDSRDQHPDPADVRGLVLSALGIAATVFALIEQPVHGFGSARVLVPLISGVALLVWFALAQRRARWPLLDRTLLRSRVFVAGTLATTVGTFVMMGLLFTTPLYLQAVRGETAFATGLRLMPLMLALVGGAAIAPILLRRLGLRGPVTLGLLVSAAGFVILQGVTATSEEWLLLASFVTIGLGFGLAMPPATDAVLGALPSGKEGSGTGLNQATKQLGGVFAIALLGSLVTSAYRSGVETATAGLAGGAGAAARESVAGALAVSAEAGGSAGAVLRRAAQDAYVSGMHLAALVCAIFIVVSAVALAFALPGRVTGVEADRTDGTLGAVPEQRQPAGRPA